MTDVLTKEQRHKNMKNIRGKDTRIEVILRKALWNKGYRYRKNYKKLPGSPDIALTKYKIAIFCDGEFFHGKDWEKLELKLKNSNNSEFWIKKISRNMERDDEINKKLNYEGWTVIRFWGEDIDYVIADIFNLIAVVFITLSIGKMIVNSINTFADALNGISMFGSSGVIDYIIVTAVVMVIMLVLEIVSCFLSREKKNAIKVVVSEK